jgi:solute carrier family 35, member F1/2
MGTSIRLRLPWWKYLVMSILDVLPNVLVLLSFKYTSLTNSILLGSLCVPSVMFFSRILLKTTFFCHQYMGVLLCVLGGALIVYSDVSGTADSGVVDAIDVLDASASGGLVASDAGMSEVASSTTADNWSYLYYGDLIAIAASLIYGLDDTLSEYLVKNVDRVEYVGMIGFMGMILSAIACVTIEAEALMELLSWETILQPGVFGNLVWFALANAAFYIMGSYFLVVSDATMLELSLQTTNLWAILFSIVAYQIFPSVFFYVASGVMVMGVVLYELGGCGSHAEEDGCETCIEAIELRLSSSPIKAKIEFSSLLHPHDLEKEKHSLELEMV